MLPELEAILARAKNRRYDPRLSHLTGTYRFDVEGAGTWRVIVRSGHLDLEEGPGDADCVVTAEASDFVRIMNGEQNLVTAVMQGRAGVAGDMVLAQQLASFLPGPTEERS